VGAASAFAAAIGQAWGDVRLVHYEATAAAALAAAAGARFDAVLVQPRLAQGSGNALLGVLKRDHPELVRCLLLDDGRDAPGLAALENVHRLFHRPLDPLALRAALDAVLALRRRLESPMLAEAVGRVGRLPPPPALSIDLMKRTENPDVSAREVATLVESDPTLAAKVLRLCNSAMYSGGRRIDDIHSAVVVLGNLTLRRLVMAGEIFSMPRGKGNDSDHAVAELRERSLLASRMAARLLQGKRADLAATAALLAGVGQMLPSTRIPWAPQPGEPADWPTYAEAGAYLLGLWGLPDVLVEAAALHATPAQAAESGLGLVGACHVAWAHVDQLPLDEAWVDAAGLADQRAAWSELADAVRAGG